MQPSWTRRVPAILTLAFVICAYSAAQSTAIVGARVEVGDGTVIDNATVLIESGRISAVANALSVPAGARIVDAKGMTIYPGFLDGYTTRGTDLPAQEALPTPPDSQNTAPPFMWPDNRKGIRGELRAATALKLGDLIESNRRQGILAAHVAPGGATVRGTSTLVVYREKDPVLVQDVAHELAFRAGSGQGYPGSLMGLIALLRQTLLDARHHLTQKSTGANSGEAANASLEGLSRLFESGGRTVFYADSQREIQRALDLADEFDLPLMIAGGREAYRVLDLVQKKRVPIFVNLYTGEAPQAARDDASELEKALAEERRAQWDERTANVLRLHEAGVPFAFSTDGDSVSNFLKNVRSVIFRGLPREAALKALTAAPAEIFGVSSDLGSVAAGKKANLVVMSGPFDDDKSEVKLVFVEGEQIEISKEGGK